MALRALEFERSHTRLSLLPPETPSFAPTDLFDCFYDAFSTLPPCNELAKIVWQDRVTDVVGNNYQNASVRTGEIEFAGFELGGFKRGSFEYGGKILTLNNCSLMLTRKPLPGKDFPHEEFSLRIFKDGNNDITLITLRDEQIFGILPTEHPDTSSLFAFNLSANDEQTLARGYQLFSDFVHGV